MGILQEKNTGVGCHALLQEIFPTQQSNLGLQHCRWILYCVDHTRVALVEKLLPTEGKKEALTVKDRSCLIKTRNGSREDIGKELVNKTILMH